MINMGFKFLDGLSAVYRFGPYLKRLKKKRKQLCTSILVLFIVITGIRLHTKDYTFITNHVEVTRRDFSEHVKHWNVSYWKPKHTKRILIWTPVFDTNTSQVAGIYNMALKTCPIKCVATDNKAKLSISDAVMFHAANTRAYTGSITKILDIEIEYPFEHRPDQVWVFWNMEPVTKTFGTTRPDTYNWTMTYRRESTIPISYSTYRKQSPQELAQHTRLVQEQFNYFKTKTKFATTAISNCNPSFPRIRVIKELQNYIDLDYFGRCAGRKITNNAREEIMKDFKFYIAFENSICRDYISEKMWLALERRQIPVIAAPRYNLELLPEHSYLNLFDYPTIKDLAEKMNEIGNNATLYNSYFDWTRTWTRRADSDEGNVCRLCQELHINKTVQVYDIDGWLNDDLCQKPTIFSLVKTFISSRLNDLGL